MVYAAAMISLGQHGRIAQTGAADSKTLDEAARKACRSKLEALGSETDTTFAAFVRAVSAREIAAAMTGRDGRSLNTVSHDAAIELIRRAVLHARGRLSAVFVDTVGPPETYQRLLRGRFPHLHIVVSKKADRRFPVVSAASIYAKTDRDEGVKALGLDVGSGYPSDPKTVQWLAAGNLHRFFGFTNREVRQSWGPVAAVVRRECVALEFEQDRDPEDDPRQQKLSFAKPPPRRDPAFGLFLGLASTTELSLA
jgi:ribonuclease H2 subunit A